MDCDHFLVELHIGRVIKQIDHLIWSMVQYQLLFTVTLSPFSSRKMKTNHTSIKTADQIITLALWSDR